MERELNHMTSGGIAPKSFPTTTLTVWVINPWRKKMVSIITIGSVELLNGLFGLSGNGGGVEESRVELTKNRLILDQFYSTSLSLLPSQSKQTVNSSRPILSSTKHALCPQIWTKTSKPQNRFFMKGQAIVKNEILPYMLLYQFFIVLLLLGGKMVKSMRESGWTNI